MRLEFSESSKLGAARSERLTRYDVDIGVRVPKLDVSMSVIAARNAARAAKNFKEADRIRGELEAMGITLKDAKDPKTGELVTTWEVAR